MALEYFLMPKNMVKRIVVARVVAEAWIQKNAKEEYRLKIYYSANSIKQIPNLLKSLRDSKIAMEGVIPIHDLGVSESFDSVEVWSSNRVALLSLQQWLCDRGFETSGVW